MKLKPEVNKEAILRELEKGAWTFANSEQVHYYMMGVKDLFDLLKEETTKIEPIYPPGLREAWLEYKAYRKREGKGWYKTLKTEQTAIDGLMKRSNNDVNCLIEALEVARHSGNTGAYPKPKQNGQNSSEKLRSLVIEAESQGRGKPGGPRSLF